MTPSMDLLLRSRACLDEFCADAEGAEVRPDAEFSDELGDAHNDDCSLRFAILSAAEMEAQ